MSSSHNLESLKNLLKFSHATSTAHITSRYSQARLSSTTFGQNRRVDRRRMIVWRIVVVCARVGAPDLVQRTRLPPPPPPCLDSPAAPLAIRHFDFHKVYVINVVMLEKLFIAQILSLDKNSTRKNHKSFCFIILKKQLSKRKPEVNQTSCFHSKFSNCLLF